MGEARLVVCICNIGFKEEAAGPLSLHRKKQEEKKLTKKREKSCN